ncbi:hypothetical protein KY290_020599 [Solanum tuberosum]|uniref:Uncharacterized protein n=1 Tax=Solanum tuberosum TaxID=4113 RepID=A0ABQ7UZ38_SOLTU|nr:hypothetical protein KY290_020599 [Solanum tuberosum]
MVLDERIQIPHYVVGWGESCSAKLGVQCSYGGSILERELKGPSKRSERVMGNLSLYVAREPPSTSLATVLAQKGIETTTSASLDEKASKEKPLFLPLRASNFPSFALSPALYFRAWNFGVNECNKTRKEG